MRKYKNKGKDAAVSTHLHHPPVPSSLDDGGAHCGFACWEELM